VLLSHIVLAAAMVPFVLTTLYRALGADFPRHVRVARLTLPVWLYVSVTGVVVYFLLRSAY
jgi:putative membrane protein